jgi:hypothetical protein
MAKVYLSELQKQLELINQKLQELEDAAYQGALSPRFRKQDILRAKGLLKRKAEVEDEIINFKFQ